MPAAQISNPGSNLKSKKKCAGLCRTLRTVPLVTYVGALNSKKVFFDNLSI